jgi:hypothetical protein
VGALAELVGWLGVAKDVGVGVGCEFGVVAGVGFPAASEEDLDVVPLLQTNFLPLFVQVNFFP